jgi:N-acetylmuramoyl-L-alanine amidase
VPEAVRHSASPNFDARPEGGLVDMLVLHYTGMPSAAEALARLVDPTARVSAHYMVEEDGAIWRLVEEDARAWHAGVAFWRGASDINARSIGIEIVNPGHEFGYRPFPEPQMCALVELAADIVARHPIPARNVVGHADVAPQRKMDPGERFDWRRLARAGIGLWPDDCWHEARADDRSGDEIGGGRRRVRDMLAAIGYQVTDPDAALVAFQRHFRPHRVDGLSDAETVRRLQGLLAIL